MKKPVKKNKAAVALNRLRNAKMTPEERSLSASNAGKGRLKSMTQEQRSAVGKAGAAARWGKPK